MLKLLILCLQASYILASKWKIVIGDSEPCNIPLIVEYCCESDQGQISGNVKQSCFSYVSPGMVKRHAVEPSENEEERGEVEQKVEKNVRELNTEEKKKEQIHEEKKKEKRPMEETVYPNGEEELELDCGSESGMEHAPMKKTIPARTMGLENPIEKELPQKTSEDEGGALQVIENCECGLSSINVRTYTHQTTDDLSRHPWLVSIYQPNVPLNPWGVCGGSLITLDTILTTAACVDGFKSKDDIVFRLVSDWIWDRDVNIGVSKIIVHPHYQKKLDFFNDIAILKLERPVTCTSYSRPICVPNWQITDIGKQMFTAGWVSDYDSIQEGTVTIIKKMPCGDSFDQNRICTQDEDKTVCQGGIGTPGIMVYEGRFYVAGVAIGDPNNCDQDGPTLFNKVQHYEEFIRNNVNG